MQPFVAASPDLTTAPATRAFRSRDDDALLATIKATKPPLADDVLAELIAITYTFPTTRAHPRGADLKKAAKKLVDKHAEPILLETLKGVSNKMHTLDERLRGLDHPLALPIARAIAFHSWHALSVPFERDAAFRAYLLDVALGRAQRDAEPELKLGELYTEWHGSHGSATSLTLTMLPATLADELTALRTRHPFTGLSLWACKLTTLPPEFAGVAPWLTSLSLAYNAFETLPDVILSLEHLEDLTLLGCPLADLPSLAPLRALRRLDLGNETRMTAIPASVCALDQVRELRVGNGTIKVVPDAIGGMTSLEVLDLQSAKVSKLPASLAKLPKLREVNLRWTKVDPVKARALLPAQVEITT